MARALYQLRVAGPVPTELLRELGGMNVTLEPAETLLYGSLPDQSALFGLLIRIHDFGLQLVEVRRLADDDAPAPIEPTGRDDRR